MYIYIYIHMYLSRMVLGMVYDWFNYHIYININHSWCGNQKQEETYIFHILRYAIYCHDAPCLFPAVSLDLLAFLQSLLTPATFNHIQVDRKKCG